MTRTASVLLILFAFAVPWEYSLDLGEPFGNIARILGLLLLAAAVFSVMEQGSLQGPGAVQWLSLALYLYFACSYFWTISPEMTLGKIRGYFQVMMIVWLVWELARAPRDLRSLMRAFVAGCWVLALQTILSYVAAGPLAEQARYVAEGQDPNDVARFLDLGFPLAALLFATEGRRLARLLAIAYVPFGLLAVMLTASRGGFFGALTALLGSAVLLVLWRPRGASMVFLGLAATVGALWLFVPLESLDRLATIPSQLTGGDLNDRVGLWIAGWHAFARSPWLGYGAGTFAAAAGLAAEDTAHNTVMAMLVTGGLAGTAIFTATVGAVLWAMARTRGLLRVALGTAMAVWVVTSMVGSVEENRTTWLIFGMVALAGRLAIEQPRSLAYMFAGVETRSKAEAQALAVR
jgi:O-antigen ligase/polysaccharide polymerase Wzy-like membrane protein